MLIQLGRQCITTGSKRNFRLRCDLQFSAITCYHQATVRPTALCIMLALAALPALVQRENPSQDKPASQTTAPSSLSGNWQLTGNRERKLYPLLSLAIHVNGKQITAAGDDFVVCPASPRDGVGGSQEMIGEISPDGNFTLRTMSSRNTLQLTVAGKIPDAGSTNWPGTYKFTSPASHGCAFDQEGSFTATLLARLAGTFSGPVTMSYPSAPPPPGYTGPSTARLKFTITAAQGGEFLVHEKKVGAPFIYLPLTGTINVSGSACFNRGASDTNPFANNIQGARAHLNFEMNDESELSVIAVYTSPQEAGLEIQAAFVKGGKCDKQAFAGTLQRQ